MTALARWDPLRDVTTLHDAMNQLLEQAVLRPGSGVLGMSGSVVGAMDVVELEGRYLCQIALPGVNPDGVDLTVRQNTLTIRATVQEWLPEEQRKNATYLLREFTTGEFTRSITFPKDVNPDAVEARLDHGVLSVIIGLAQHAQPRRITIQNAGSTAQQPQIVGEHSTSQN
nr:Hsp20/alpha crystallin family protein [Ktedonobacterales bacterium]